jgi:hypothetical protein
VKNEKDSSVMELKGKMYSISKLGSQVDILAATTRAIGEYVGQEFGHEMRMLVLYGKAASFVFPTFDARRNRMSWSGVKTMICISKHDDEAKVFAIVLSCCNEPMINKVEGHPEYAQMEQDCDVAALLEVIKESGFPWEAILGKPTSKCMEAVGVLPPEGGQNNDPCLSAVHGDCGSDRTDVWDNCTIGDGGCWQEQHKDWWKVGKSKRKMIVVLFVEGANKGFKLLLRDLENDSVLGANKYPATLAKALKVLMVYAEQPVYKSIMKKLKKKQMVETDEGSPEVAFVQMKKTKRIKKGLFLLWREGTQG